MTGITLRLHMPLWHGGNAHDYWFGAQLLAWLAPAPFGPGCSLSMRTPTS